MLVSERVFAAAYRAQGQDARVFDDIGCLRNAVRSERDRAAITFWFHDAATREWIAGDRASFVHAASLKTPMSGGMLAYDGVAAAERGAAEHRGRVIRSIDDLLAPDEAES
jgi:copper chaperone NosL